jgi:hypothetical protein
VTRRRLGVFVSSLSMLFILGCSLDYNSAMNCLSHGDCFRNEECRFDEDGKGQCVSLESHASVDATSQPLSDATPEQAGELGLISAAADMGSVPTDMGSVPTDMGSVQLDASTSGSEMAMAALPDLVCPPSEGVANARLECEYSETEQRRDYCQYFVTEDSCESFCSSIGLFTCSTVSDCCWNNDTLSSCAPGQTNAWSCTMSYESVICRCFETAR